MKNREEFAQLLAVITKVYPQRLDVKKGKTTLRKVLLAACAPGKIEWYFNNIRYRSRLTSTDDGFLASGTTRNEQLHMQINRIFRSTIQVTSRLLTAQLTMWLASEMLVFAQAMNANTSIKVTHANMRPMVLIAVEVFPRKSWARHVSKEMTVWSTGSLPQKKTRRMNPNRVQEAIYKSIKDKTIKRKRSSVFGSMTVKRLRSQ